MVVARKPKRVKLEPTTTSSGTTAELDNDAKPLAIDETLSQTAAFNLSAVELAPAQSTFVSNGTLFGDESTSTKEGDLQKMQMHIKQILNDYNNGILTCPESFKGSYEEIDMPKTEFSKIFHDLILSSLYLKKHTVQQQLPLNTPIPSYSTEVNHSAISSLYPKLLIDSTISLALMRFLNFLVENVAHRLPAKTSLNACFKYIGIPEWIITVRNDISHFEMPNSNVLNKSLNHCLEFILFYVCGGTTVAPEITTKSAPNAQNGSAEVKKEPQKIDFKYLFYDSKYDTLYGLLKKCMEIFLQKDLEKNEKITKLNPIIAKITTIASNCHKATTLRAFFSPQLFLASPEHLTYMKTQLGIQDPEELAKFMFDEFSLLIKPLGKIPGCVPIILDMFFEKIVMYYEGFGDELKKYHLFFLDKFLARSHTILAPDGSSARSQMLNIFETLTKYPNQDLRPLLMRFVRLAIKLEVFAREEVDPILKLYINCIENKKEKNSKTTNELSPLDNSMSSNGTNGTSASGQRKSVSKFQMLNACVDYFVDKHIQMLS